MLTVFTYANKKYEPFVLPYIATILNHNPEAVVEVALDRPFLFHQKNPDGFAIIQEYFGDRFVLSRAKISESAILKREIPANSKRFLIEPSVKNKYVYIGDIDIINLFNICDFHIKNMEKLGLPYSNIVRPSGVAMSGLHFTKWDAYYPICAIPEHTKPNLDEALLYDLVKARGNPVLEPGQGARPILGYHLSLNTDPRTSKTCWGGLKDMASLERYMALAQTPMWRDLIPFMEKKYRYVLLVLETFLCSYFGHETASGLPTPHLRPGDIWD